MMKLIVLILGVCFLPSVSGQVSRHATLDTSVTRVGLHYERRSNHRWRNDAYITVDKHSDTIVTRGGAQKNEGQPFSALKRRFIQTQEDSSTQTDDSTDKTSLNLWSRHKEDVQKVVVATIGIALSYHLYQNYNHKIPSTEQIKACIQTTVSNIHQKGKRGVAYYAFGLALCECVGISTLPIETTGGYVFGLSTGLFANSIGKVGGASLAYALGRTLLYAKIKAKLFAVTSDDANNDKTSLQDVLKLLTNSIGRKPFASSLLLRFSIFPELVKNLSLSVMDPVKYWQVFLPVTCLHVLPFTVLWTVLGHDSALRLVGDNVIPPNLVLNGILFGVTMFGFFGAPLLTAWWVRQMIKDHE